MLLSEPQGMVVHPDFAPFSNSNCWVAEAKCIRQRPVPPPFAVCVVHQSHSAPSPAQPEVKEPIENVYSVRLGHTRGPSTRGWRPGIRSCVVDRETARMHRGHRGEQDFCLIP